MFEIKFAHITLNHAKNFLMWRIWVHLPLLSLHMGTVPDIILN